jgi:2-polyprenyl-3-methyl-5-hydroxy-6-metoxy-1,4-benzoquinol methylase
VDRKWIHELHRCGHCALLYRWPYETAEELEQFYQLDYAQSGLTTELPDAQSLDALLDSGFKGSSKDFTRVVGLLDTLSIPRGAEILDFGANWGYGVWQFRRAGYDALGFELSKPRAMFGRKLGVDIVTQWADVESKAPFDVVFSSHVLEHTPDPASALAQQMDVLKPGGWLIALVPNGSESFRDSSPDVFHRLWGRVHPVMLSDSFFKTVLGEEVVFLGALAQRDLNLIRSWSDGRVLSGDLTTNEILMMTQKRSVSVCRRDS